MQRARRETDLLFDEFGRRSVYRLHARRVLGRKGNNNARSIAKVCRECFQIGLYESTSVPCNVRTNCSVLRYILECLHLRCCPSLRLSGQPAGLRESWPSITGVGPSQISGQANLAVSRALLSGQCSTRLQCDQNARHQSC